MKKDLRNALNEIKYFLLDMDGTLYFDDELIGEMDKTLAFLREKGKKLIFLTNNSSKTNEEYVKKLKRIRLFGDGDEVVSSGIACAEYLAEVYGGEKVYLLGTDALKEQFKKRGINVVDGGDADICVLAFDTELTYEKLRVFTDNLQNGAKYIATHPDVTCPAPRFFVPDAGAFIELIKAATGRVPEKIIGKPNTGMGEVLMKKYGAKKNEFIMVGDRLNTDIKFGNNCGFYSLLVLSGESKESDIGENTGHPDFILDNFNDIIRYF